MEVWMERTASHSHRAAIGFTPPPGVTIKQIPAEKSIGGMMLSGELHAVIHYIVNPNLVDRSTADLWRHPDIKPLFAEPARRGRALLPQDRIFPINHGMVIRREIVEKASLDRPQSLQGFRARERGRRPGARRARRVLPRRGAPGARGERRPARAAAAPRHRRQPERTRDRRALLARAGLTPRVLALEEVFAASSMSSERRYCAAARLPSRASRKRCLSSAPSGRRRRC